MSRLPAIEVTIREASPEDREALLAHTLLLNRYEEPLTGDRRLDREGAEETLAEVDGRVADTGGRVLVAVAAGQVIGHLHLAFETAPAYVRSEMRAFALVKDLFVTEAWRGRGVASALLAEAERLGRERGVPRMMIGLVEGNEPALRAYRRFGFKAHAIELIKDIGPPLAVP